MAAPHGDSADQEYRLNGEFVPTWWPTAGWAIRKHSPDCNRSQDVGSEELAFEAIEEVGPSGNFFSASHTLEHYKTAFYTPFLSNWINFETWDERGSIRTPERANKMWKQILNEFEAPPMDDSIREELGAFVGLRKEQGGAATDF